MAIFRLMIHRNTASVSYYLDVRVQGRVTVSFTCWSTTQGYLVYVTLGWVRVGIGPLQILPIFMCNIIILS